MRVRPHTPRRLRAERAAALCEELRGERDWGLPAMTWRHCEVQQEHVATRDAAKTEQVGGGGAVDAAICRSNRLTLETFGNARRDAHVAMFSALALA